MTPDICLKPDKCPSWTGKHCGHAVFYGVGACRRRDGRPDRPAGCGCESPFKQDEKADED